MTALPKQLSHKKQNNIQISKNTENNTQHITMGVKKQLYGHGDPLLMEVVKGLKDTLHEEKAAGGMRGVGERSASQGM